MLLVFFIVLTGIGFYLFYHYVTVTSRLAELKKNCYQAEKFLQQAQEREQSLKNELVTLQNKLQQSFEDPITKLPSWLLFEDRLRQHVHHSQRYGLNFGIMHIDFDGFIAVTDVLNDEINRTLLCEVGQRLQACVRQIDSVSRQGETTFVILLARFHGQEAAALVAQRILHALAQPFQIKGREIFISTCIGIAVYPRDGDNATVLLRHAELALQGAKVKGKHCYQYYYQLDDAKSEQGLLLHTGLQLETIYQEFSLSYQPIQEVSQKKWFCLRTLLKWQHPQFGLLFSKELFSLAEQQGDAGKVYIWLLQTICQRFKQWQSSAGCPQYVSMPLAVKQLQDAHFIYDLAKVLQEAGVAPQHVLLEITGQLDSISRDTLEKAINMLRYIGVKISVSQTLSFEKLNYLSIDYLRLEPVFVHELLEDSKNQILLQKMLEIGKALNFVIIVEGVDTQEQKEYLQNLGCSLLQGRYIGEAMEENSVLSLFS